MTAAHVRSRHYEEVIAPSLSEVIEPATAGLGEPMADSSTIPTLYFSRSSRLHVTFALIGYFCD